MQRHRAVTHIGLGYRIVLLHGLAFVDAFHYGMGRRGKSSSAGHMREGRRFVWVNIGIAAGQGGLLIIAEIVMCNYD